VLVEQSECQGLAGRGQAHVDAALVVRIGMPLQQPVALQPIQQASDGGAGDPGAFGELVRRQRRLGALQQEEQNESAFAQPQRGQPLRAVLVNRTGQ